MQSQPYAQDGFTSWIDQWTAELEAAQRRVSRRSLPGWILMTLGVVAMCLIAMLIDQYIWIGIFLLVAGLALGGVLLSLAGKLGKELAPRLAAGIQETIQVQGLDREQVVDALYGRTKGKVRDAVLAVIDPHVVGRIEARTRGEAALKQASGQKIVPLKINVNAASGTVSSVTIQGEADVDRFAGVAIDYLAHRGYAEGIAALAMVQMLYMEIAPLGSEMFARFSQTNEALRDVAVSAQKIFSSFDLKPEIKAVKESVAKRRTQTLIELLLLAQSQQTGLDELATAAGLQSVDLRVRDAAFVGGCIDYIGKQASSSLVAQLKGYELLALIPDARTRPYVMEGFKLLPFFPQGIEAMAAMGEETHPGLIEAVQTGSGSLRFNAALALGFMNVEQARGPVARALPNVTDPIERIGMCYTLLRLGGTAHMKTLVAFLDHADEQVRHCAAIALEHLEQSLDDAVFLDHLNDSAMLVRLRLTRKLGSQDPQTPALIDALIERFDDTSEDVRDAAVAALGGLPPERVYRRMVKLTESSTVRVRLCACEVLGKLDRPGAVPLLTATLNSTTDKDTRRAVISALGELGAVGAAGQIAAFLGDEDLGNAAFWALLRISLKDKDAGIQPLQGRSQYRMKRAFLQALHGEQSAKNELRGMLKSGTDLVALVEAMEYAGILREPEFEPAFRQLLTYRQPLRFPGDRYISYMALKALANIQLAKTQ